MKKKPLKKDLTPLFKSKFEKVVWEKLIKSFKTCSYETSKYKYIQPVIHREYTPDFNTGHTKVYLEAKGKLDLETRKKMVWFKECNPNIRIIFVFMNPDVKIRKGSKTSYGDWATKAGFEWLDSRKDWISAYKEMLKS
jgi:hypothetical protein